MPDFREQIEEMARSKGWHVYPGAVVTLMLVRSPRLIMVDLLQENERLTLNQQQLGGMLTQGDNEYFVWRSYDIKSIEKILDAPMSYQKTTADRIRLALELAPQRPSMDQLGSTLDSSRQYANKVLLANPDLYEMWERLPEQEPMMVYQFCDSCGEFTQTRKHNYVNTQLDPMVAYCDSVCRLRERRKAAREVQI